MYLICWNKFHCPQWGIIIQTIAIQNFWVTGTTKVNVLLLLYIEPHGIVLIHIIIHTYRLSNEETSYSGKYLLFILVSYYEGFSKIHEMVRIFKNK